MCHILSADLCTLPASVPSIVYPVISTIFFHWWPQPWPCLCLERCSYLNYPLLIVFYLLRWWWLCGQKTPALRLRGSPRNPGLWASCSSSSSTSDLTRMASHGLREQVKLLSPTFKTTPHLAPTCPSSCPHCLRDNQICLLLVPKFSSLHFRLPTSLLPPHPLTLEALLKTVPPNCGLLFLQFF